MKKNHKGKRSLVTSDSLEINIKLNKNYSAMLNYLAIQKRKTPREFLCFIIEYNFNSKLDFS